MSIRPEVLVFGCSAQTVLRLAEKNELTADEASKIEEYLRRLESIVQVYKTIHGRQ